MSFNPIVNIRNKFLLYAIIPGILCLSVVLIKNTGKQEIAFQYLTNDSVLLDIYEDYDTAGLLEGYTSHIKTPVCEDSLCYEAELIFYWNLIGNFQRFSIIPGKPLTKLDHIPFNQSDYAKLKKILLIRSPSFVYLKRNQLVEENDSDIDGITSATVTQMKEDMVEGAIYTCFTLWHIANGDIAFKIKEHTRKNLNANLIRKLLSANKVEDHYFILENIDSGYFKLFLPEILSLTEKYRDFFMSRFIEKIPAYLLEDQMVQEFFSSNFNQLEYSSQTILISKLTDIRLKSSTLDALTEGIYPANSQQNEQIIRLVIKNADAENIEVLIKLFEVLSSRQIIVSEVLYEELISLEQHDKLIKKEVRKFKKASVKQH